MSMYNKLKPYFIPGLIAFMTLSFGLTSYLTVKSFRTPKYAYVDMKVILRSVGKDVGEKVGELIDQEKREFQRLIAELEREEEKLKKLKKKKSSKAREKRKESMKKIKMLKALRGRKGQELSQKFTEIMMLRTYKAFKEVRETIKKIAREKGFSAIFHAPLRLLLTPSEILVYCARISNETLSSEELSVEMSEPGVLTGMKDISGQVLKKMGLKPVPPQQESSKEREQEEDL